MIQILIHKVKDRHVAYQGDSKIISAMSEQECIERVREIAKGATLLFYREKQSLPFYSTSTERNTV